MPGAWPEPRFDRVVISELGYSLRDAVELTRRGRCERAALNGDTVHRLLDQAHGLQRPGGDLDAGMRLDVWQADELSVAAREGLP